MKNKNSVSLLRLNLLFLFVFFLFSILILRLGFIQIVYGADLKKEIERKEDITLTNPVPRGKMLDRNYKVIVDNFTKYAITYRKDGASQQSMLKTAEKLADFINKDLDKVTDRDKKDYWILKNPIRADAKITKQEKRLYKLNKLSSDELYHLKLERITEEELRQLSPHNLETVSIFREFNLSDKTTSQMVKNNHVSPREFAVVSENLQSLPGVDTVLDWERSYPFGETFQSMLGVVSKSDEGLPAEQLPYFLTKGYNRNERVGKSYLELKYEDILHGRKSKIKNVTDPLGNVLDTRIDSLGQRGKDLVLSIDIQLQKEIEKILEDELIKTKKWRDSRLLDRAYAVVMEPHTGEVLAMAGKRVEKNKENGQWKITDDSIGTFTTAYNVGSTVKGATILTGFKTGAISPGVIFDDKALKIKDTPLKKSYAYLGKLNDINALKKSSNVYMFHTAIQIAKGHYQYNQPLEINDPQAMEKIRKFFAGYGLGSRTGIDLPNEQAGLKGTSKLPGFMLDLVIGQYDTYTTMQLAQYISTIANGGYRMKPQLVKEIREPVDGSNELGPIAKEMHPAVLNSIQVKNEWLKRVQRGFAKVMQERGGTAYEFFRNAPYSPAGKTGTAQAFYDGPIRNQLGKEPIPVINLSLVGYAPSYQPEMAVAILVPWAYQGDKDNRINVKIGRRIMDKYFELKKTQP